MLQKPTKTSKSKDHLTALERRISLWTEGHLLELLREGETIQKCLTCRNKRKTTGEFPRNSWNRCRKVIINIKILTKNTQNGILPLNEQTLQLLKQKHPEATTSTEEILLPDEPEIMHPIKHEKIDAELIRKAAIKTKGGAGPLGMDGDGWWGISASKHFSKSSDDLCKEFAAVIKRLCVEENQSASLEAFLAFRLIPLDKYPGLRPIGVEMILRLIAGKVVVAVVRWDVITSVGSLQVCAGHKAGCEATVHAMHTIFEEERTEAVLLIDASTAFNSVNRGMPCHHNLCT